jgi:hypothetical protein
MSKEHLANLGRALSSLHGHSLTLANLRAIERAMKQIAPIDRSQAFELYLDEVKGRIDRAERFG